MRRLCAIVIFSAVVVGSIVSGAASGSAAVTTPGEPLRIRAIGDAVTSGFGVFADGTPMSFAQTIPCLPHNRLLNDRCSSNSTLGPGDLTTGPTYSADFGLGNRFSWAAQMAATLGSVDYANYAVSGSEPRHWMNLTPDAAHPDDGYLHDELLRLEADDPDLVLVTLGGSTLLLDAFGGVGLGCVALDDQATQAAVFRGCIDAILNKQLLKQSLMAIYFDVLAQAPQAHIVASTYSASYPALSLFDPWQTAAMTDAVNEQIAGAVESVKAAGATWAEHISVSNPRPPLAGECQRSTFGRLVMRNAGNRASSVCVGQEMVLDSDLGIHPNRAGQASYAAGALAAITANAWFPATPATP